jgi:hypothetical protein
VSNEAYQAAQHFIKRLSLGLPQPELSADPDGCITFEWRSSPRNTLLVSVRPDGGVDYAALVGSAKVHGIEPSFVEFPEILKTLILRVARA